MKCSLGLTCNGHCSPTLQRWRWKCLGEESSRLWQGNHNFLSPIAHKNWDIVSFHQLFLQRHGSSGTETDSSWHKISDVKEKDSAELIVALGPEDASNLITSQSSENRWVDEYLRDERPLPPFGFEQGQGGQELKLSHLSGSTNLNTKVRRLCFHWKLQKASVSSKENKPLAKASDLTKKFMAIWPSDRMWHISASGVSRKRKRKLQKIEEASVFNKESKPLAKASYWSNK